MVAKVYADVPYDPKSNPEQFAEAQKLQQAIHDENQRAKSNQAQ